MKYISKQIRFIVNKNKKEKEKNSKQQQQQQKQDLVFYFLLFWTIVRTKRNDDVERDDEFD